MNIYKIKDAASNVSSFDSNEGYRNTKKEEPVAWSSTLREEEQVNQISTATSDSYNRYTIIDILGTGSYGSVCLVVDKYLTLPDNKVA